MNKIVNIGNIKIGGGNKIAVQSMTTFKPSDIKNTIDQILRLENAGCDIVRFSIQSEEDAKAIKEIKKNTHIPLVADIHFDYRLALACIENGVDKIRINPGNIGSDENVKKVADALKEHKIPVRVGANTGSIEKELLSKYGRSEISLGESALKNVAILEKAGVNDIVISVKASDVPLMIKAYKYVANKVDYPMHLGVTEAGGVYNGIIKNSVGIGSLLSCGIGDTIRVSLSADPVEEVYAGKGILRSLGLDKNYIDLVSCPTCGRCEWNMFELQKKVEEYIKRYTIPVKIAVMGCVVNGPGEAKECELGIAGGKETCVIFRKGEVFKTVKKEDAEKEFFKELEICIRQEKSKRS